MWQYFVLISSLCTLPLPSSGFWWPKPTTESPRAQMLQQIPLTYFRTYTYQPLASGPFGVPLFGFGAAQTPLLSSRHYDPYAVTSYAAARRHDVAAAVAAAAAGYKQDVTPPALSSSSGSLASTTTTTTTTTPAPTTTTSTTTTTTTTTPAPTTTTTTTAATTTAAAAAGTVNTVAATSSTDASNAFRYAAYNADYPTYSRRVNNLYNVRPQYPYPDYFNYQPQSTMVTDKSSGVGGVGGTRIQFVPCMCPVSMPSMSALSSLTALNSVSSTDRDRPSTVAIGNSPTAAASTSAIDDVAPAERNIVTLQARHMDSEEADLEMEEDDADGIDTSIDVNATKPSPEPQFTTPPAVESNSLL